MAITGDQRLLKRINRMALVRLVRSQPGLSRAELSLATGLTKSTVSLLVQELVDEGWLREEAVLVTGAIGRRPTPLFLDGRRLVMIGVELEIGQIRIVSVSLDGQVLSELRTDFSLTASVHAVLEDVAGLIADEVDAQRAAGRDLLGIGMAVPGAVQESSGLMVVAPNLGWRNVAVGKVVQEALAGRGKGALPFFVQNDGDVAALGEVEFASGPVADPLIFIRLGIGVGAGVVVGGRLLLGQRGFAGEVGHIQMQEGGPRCSCGRDGCAEAFFGLGAMANAAGCSVEALLERAQAGDPAVVAVLEAAGERLGVLMHNLWTMLDPGVIVVGGPACQLGKPFLGTARQTLERMGHMSKMEAPPVIESRTGELSAVIGAAALVLHRLLRPL